MMDHTFLPRSFWAGDNKFLQHPADLCTSVVVTRSVPAGACFGPCALQNTFYDTIAFIAQKSSDSTTKCYVFRVDPEAMRNSALVLSWLRLVQAARSREEQNMEAFLKAGQLYVRTTREIRQDEELLVWYDQELSNLLGFRDATRGPRQDFNCGKCNQVFNNEYPSMAHCRFLCVQGKADPCSREVSEHKHVETKRQHRVTDFHNLARDLEHKMSASSEDAVELSPKRRRYEESPSCKGRKTVLLEKTNISNDDNITQLSKGCLQGAGDQPLSSGKLKADKKKLDHLGCRNDVAGERKEAKCVDVRAERGESSGVHSSSSSAFSLVLSNSHSEQKSAFCKPSKRTSPVNPQAQLSCPTAPPGRLEDLPDAFSSRTLLGYNDLMASAMVSGDMQTAHSPAVVNNAFHYAPEHWHRTTGTPLQSTASLTILPPTFSSFGVSVQNWCAKCNLSFRMTSDLVFHMRSHHKKEFAAESQVKKRREEKLTCPICHEYFRERHHLSRHMTSHN